MGRSAKKPSKQQNLSTFSQKKTKRILKTQKKRITSNSQSNQQSIELDVYKSGIKQKRQKRLKHQNLFPKNLDKLKQNILVSLYNQLDQTNHNPYNIIQWNYGFKQVIDRVFGTYYIIMGPRQSGKLSLVRYAISKQKCKLFEIFIDCNVLTTENQIYKKILTQIKKNNLQKFHFFFQSQKEYDRLLEQQNINFTKLGAFINVCDLKFVIIIKNAEHLVTFSKQYVLYNLFEWMKTTTMIKNGGLFLLTTRLTLMDQFEKRVKSRFQGTKICLFRPEKADVYLKIIGKRIDTVTNFKILDDIKYEQQDNETKKDFKTLKKTKKNNNKKQPIFEDQEQVEIIDKKKNKKTPKKLQNSVKKQAQFQEKQIIQQQKLCKAQQQLYHFNFSTQNQQSLYDILSSCKLLTHKQLQTIRPLTFSQSLSQRSLFFQQKTSIPFSEREPTLKKLKKSITQNQQLRKLIQTQMIDITIITIPYILKCFQIIIQILNEGFIKEVNQDLLKKVMVGLFKNVMRNIFPFEVKQYTVIKRLTKIQKILLLDILKMHMLEDYPINLRKICSSSQAMLHKQIHSITGKTVNMPKMLLTMAWDSLRENQIIRFHRDRIWDYPSILTSPINNYFKAFAKIYRQGNHGFSDYAIQRLRQLNLVPNSSSYEKVSLRNDSYYRHDDDS